jgi:glycogen debranching enzyme
MRSRIPDFSMAAALLLVVTSALPLVCRAQQAFPVLNSIPAIAFDGSGPVIHAQADPQEPFTVAGERGVLVGQQDGGFEAWLLPLKVLSHLTVEANIEGYTVPINVNQMAAEIEVRPDRTVITYSHIGFTVRQIMFSPNGAAAGTGPVVLYQFDCLHPTDFTFRFTPELRWMWPERNDGVPDAEWVARGGFYVLHTDYPDLAAAVTIPGAQPGILPPYQERPKFYPTELKLHIDPLRDKGRLFPLLMAVGTNTAAASTRALGETLSTLNAGIAASYQAHAQSYKKFLVDSVSIETPDKKLDEAFKWAEVSIEGLRAIAQPSGETALVAGYYESGDSARPGFGWFFGRDSLYTLYAVNGYGDFALSKNELEFLIRRQRSDGKIMHEWSQTAANLYWQAFPYMYAAADATPLFLLAVDDYVRASGDVEFLSTHRDAIEKAWAFETDPAHDTDHDGIYDNSQGTGWVESWPTGMPHQEVYLALLDQQASAAMAEIEKLLKDSSKAETAERREETIAKTINVEYPDPEKGCYAFSRDMAKDGAISMDRTTTVYPALAWWSNLPGTSTAGGDGSILAQPFSCLSHFADATLNTDWGLRDVANNEKFYDGMSYHQGSVWPLFTGWAALAEYRGGQPLAGYQMLMENANLTRAQDLGAVTELLSGDFYVPFGRSTSHQLWSSAMVITPILRGMFGISIDAQTKTITVNPQLPAGWEHAKVLNLPIPGGPTSLSFDREGASVKVSLGTNPGHAWHLRSDTAGGTSAANGDARGSRKSPNASSDEVRIPLPAVEIDLTPANLTNVAEGVRAALPDRPPLPGARTSRFRIVHSEYSEHKLVLTAEGLGGSEGVASLVRHGRFIPKVQNETSGPGAGEAKISMREPGDDPAAPALLVVDFPPGDGWKTMTVTLTW